MRTSVEEGDKEQLGGNSLNRKGKPRRHYPNDLVRDTIESDRLIDDASITAEAALPQFVTKDDDMISGLVFFRQKDAAQLRLHTEDGENV